MKVFDKCYVSLSFDDGRDDNYTVALPILEKYNLKATFNIATAYVDGSLKDMPSPRRAMSIEQVHELGQKGHELAGHGHRHLNTIEDILLGLNNLSTIKDNSYASANVLNGSQITKRGGARLRFSRD